MLRCNCASVAASDPMNVRSLFLGLALGGSLTACDQRSSQPTPQVTTPARARVAKPASDPRPVEPAIFEAQLFASDVELARLPASVGIETLGGVVTILLPRGTPLPLEKTEVFSTAVDNQPTVQITAVMGERQTVTDNRLIGKLTIEEIPAAPKGVPQIEVKFAVDGAGKLQLSARDRGSQARRPITVEAAAPAPATASEVAALVAPPAGSLVELAKDQVARARLYGDDVGTDTLPLSIGIETLRGESGVFLRRGTPLPAQFREIFSTAVDNQATVDVHILQGERTMARDNLSLGRFKLAGIPAAPRGVPQIVVTIDVDAAGKLAVSARDQATGRQQSIEMLGNPDHTVLGQEHIDRMLEDAEEHREADAALRKRLAEMLKLEGLCVQTETLLKDPTVKLDAGVRTALTEHAATARLLLGQVVAKVDDAKLERAFKSLESAAHTAARDLYKGR